MNPAQFVGAVGDLTNSDLFKRAMARRRQILLEDRPVTAKDTIQVTTDEYQLLERMFGNGSVHTLLGMTIEKVSHTRMSKLRIASIHGYRDQHPMGESLEDGVAGVITHPAGVGQIRVYTSDGDEVYIPGDDFLRFVRGYKKFGAAIIADWGEAAAITGVPRT